MIAILDKNLKVTGYFSPESMALNLEERKSTATVVTGPEVADIAVGTFLRDETEPGAGIVWRVRARNIQYERQTKTYTLEHVINTLRDNILFGEVTPATITGNKNAKSCTAEQAARYALGRQSLWSLGDFAYGVTNPYSFNGETVMAALETISGSLEDCIWEYDLTKLPFKLHIRKLSSAVDSEMRMDRNIQSLRVNIDMSQMYTRFYPIGKNDLHLSGNYVSRNESTYGTVCHVETDQSKESDAELRRWANEKLKRHAEPAVTVTISGMDLSRATGEALDKLTLNKRCRVPLPDYGTTINEKIVKLSWSDKISEPDKVTVTLANTLTDVATIINRIMSNASGGGRSSAKKAKEDHAWIEDTEDHVYLVAEAIIGDDPNGVNWSRVATLGVDGSGIHGRVTKAEGDIVVAESRIDAAEDRISLVVEGKGKDGKIKVASIVTAINNDQSSIALNADKIALNGNTRMNDVLTITEGDAAFLKPVRFGTSYANMVTITLGTVTAPQFHFRGGASDQYYCSASDFGKMIKTASKTGNTLKLTQWNGTELSFSRATALSATWSGGKITMSANDSSISDLVHEIRGGDGTRSGNTVSIPIHAYTATGQYIEPTGRTVSYVLSTHTQCASGLARYNNQQDGKKELFVKSGSSYLSVGEHYWYWRDTNQNLTTYYD